MRDFENIQKEIEDTFNKYLDNTLLANGFPRKYFYWSRDFFTNEGNLSFKFYPIDVEIKQELNELGRDYFGSTSIYFEINKSSHRSDILINNIAQLFNDENKNGQTSRYEYIREYTLWVLINKLLHLRQIEKTNRILSTKEIDQELFKKLEHDIKNLQSIESIQKTNFLDTYLNYLLSQNLKWTIKGYISFQSFTQYNQIIENIKGLSKDNNLLRLKIDNLYVKSEYKNKIHFIFSKQGGAGKEELRELLDIMGKEEYGYLFRGQTDSTWKLDSSLTRDERYLENEKDMYYEILSLKPDAFQNDETVYERLITMQHFGMPTRLMDVTRNPLIAIFFACNNIEKKKNDGVIYSFLPDKNTPILNFEDEKLISLKALYNDEFRNPNYDFLDNIYFIRGLAKNQRISNQSGDFIFVGKNIINSQNLNELPKLTIIIDSTAKSVLLEQLETLNIHGGSVYPDLSHMSSYIRNKYLKAKPLSNNTKMIEHPIIIEGYNESNFNSVLNNPTQLSPEKYKLYEKLILREDDTKETKELVNTFDSKEFWDSKKIEQMQIFAQNENIKSDVLKDIIEYIVYTNNPKKPPLPDAIVKAMYQKPVLKDRSKVIDELTKRIFSFVDSLKNI